MLSSEPGDEAISKARLRLVQAAGVVFANYAAYDGHERS